MINILKWIFFPDNLTCNAKTNATFTISISPNSTFEKDVTKVLKVSPTSSTNFSVEYEPIWEHHGYYARCTIKMDKPIDV